MTYGREKDLPSSLIGLGSGLLILVCQSAIPGEHAKIRQQDKPLQHEVRVINIEVPARVFRGETFVDNLALSDFEVYEDGVLQTIEAVYLIKKTNIERKEETRPFTPETARYFYLFFVLYEYNPKIREAVSFFINNAIRPEDHLVVVTPKTTYEMKKNTLLSIPKEKIVDKLTGIVKKDILRGETAYRSALRNLKRMAQSKTRAIEDMGVDPNELGETGFGSAEEYLMQYRANLDQLEAMRSLDEGKLLDFARFLKDKRGQKFVYLFYQREFTPMIMDRQTQALLDNSPILKPFLDELFGLYARTSKFDTKRVARAFVDSSITIHFLYLTTIPDGIPRAQMEERSWDVYESFSEMAQATGGLRASSSNTASLMEKASSASENYYLLYYSPKDKTADGRFRNIEVKVKTGGYRVTHLAGYTSK